MRRKYYLHKRNGIFYAELVDPQTGCKLPARSTGTSDRDDALLVVPKFPPSLLAATNGLRLGEVVALKTADIDGDILNIRHGYNPIDGLKCPLQKQMEAIGVDWKAHNIVFHSWRHFYAARMSDIKTAEEVARITGHKSRAVFDEYAAHVERENLDDMGRAARQVFGGVLEVLPDIRAEEA
jgi:hypothetical protein